MACSQCGGEIYQNEFITCEQCNKKLHWDCLDVPARVRSTAREIEDYMSCVCQECRNSSQTSTSGDRTRILVLHSRNNSSITGRKSSPTGDSCRNRAVPLPPDPLPEYDFPREETVTRGDINKVNIYQARNVFITGSSNEVSHESETTQGILEKLRHGYREEREFSTIRENGEEWQLQLRNDFVDLTMVEKDLEGITTRGEIEEGFKPIFKGKRIFRSILITGDVGYGKTTLIKKLCYDWASSRCPHDVVQFDIVVNIPLGNETSSIKEAIQRKLLTKLRTIIDIGNEEKISDILKGRRLLVILEEFDKLTNVRNVVSFIEDPPLASEGFTDDLTILVTSRPSAVQDHCDLFDRRLSIIGLSEESQEEYIFRMLLNEGAVNRLIERKRRCSFLQKVSECPLLLHLICLHHRGHDAVDFSRIEPFLEIFRLLIYRSAKRNGEGNNCETLLWSNVQENQDLIRLGKLATTFLLSTRPSEIELGKEIEKEFETKESIELILGLGIFITIARKRTLWKVDTDYTFMHEKFAEALAKIYIANDSMAEPSSFDIARIFFRERDNPILRFISSLFGIEN